MNVRRRVREVIAAALETEEHRLSDDSGLNRDPTWNSLTHVAIIAALEDRFGIQFDDGEIVDAVDLETLISLTGSKIRER